MRALLGDGCTATSRPARRLASRSRPGTPFTGLLAGLHTFRVLISFGTQTAGPGTTTVATPFGINLLVAMALLMSAPASAENRSFLMGTAKNLPAGRIEMGVFEPLRLGVTDTLEIDLQPAIAFLMPNLTVRLAWTSSITTEHTVAYPTPLLMALSREGTGGILPKTTVVPHIISMTHLLYWTLDMTSDHFFTVKAGGILAGATGESTLPTMDLPLVFSRTAAWHHGFTGVVGLDFDGLLWGALSYNVDVDLFLVPDADATVHVEHSVMVGWVANSWFKLEAGYKLIWGQYPFGDQLHVLPLIDLVFALKQAPSPAQLE